jgi:flagellar protein FlaG
MGAFRRRYQATQLLRSYLEAEVLKCHAARFQPIKDRGTTDSQGDSDILILMTPNQPGPRITLNKTPDYREGYANSVQVRVNLWDFFLSFGVLDQNSPENVQIHNFQGVYLSPQQAKALANVLNQNLTQYEAAFGEIRLEPQPGSSGSVQ